MPTLRERIIAVVRAGEVTSAAISDRLDVEQGLISHALSCMRRQGRVEPCGIVETPVPGRRLLRWRVNPAYVRPSRSRPCSPETRAKIKASLRAAYPKPTRGVPVPKWVAPLHRRTYREIARVMDEETAAEWARAAKRMETPGATHAKGVHCPSLTTPARPT